MTIIAIGGGDIRKAATLAIEKEIIKHAKKAHPHLLFIPTASDDNETYIKAVEHHFGKRFKCTVDTLLLIKETPTKEEIKKKIKSADIIYVGGGNTLKMMRLWRKRGIDLLLNQAWKKGTVLAGLSAGAICWFTSGHSDSLSYYNPKHWKYINVRGLEFIPFMHCPHYDSQTLGRKRKNDLKAMVKKQGNACIAIDNHCAIEVTKNAFRILTSKRGAKAYLVYRKNGKVVEQELPQKSKPTPFTYFATLKK